MFDLDAGKLVVFGIVALAVIPPKDLPRVLRTVGKYVGQMRRMASDFQGQFMDAIKDAELDSVRKEIQSINDQAKIDTKFDPAAMMRDNITKAVDNKPADVGVSPYETVRVEPSKVASPEPHPEPVAEAHAEPLAPPMPLAAPMPLAEPAKLNGAAPPEASRAAAT